MATSPTVHITPDPETDDPFSRVGDTHSWECTCGAMEVNSPMAFTNAAIHLTHGVH